MGKNRALFLMAVAALTFSACTEQRQAIGEAEQSIEKPTARFEYRQQLNENADDFGELYVLEPTPPAFSREESVARLAGVVGVSWSSPESTREDEDGEYATLRRGVHRFKVYSESGAIEYANQERYNAINEAAFSREPVGRYDAISRAKAFANGLAKAGLVDLSEVDMDDARVYHRKMQGVSRDGVKGVERTLDTRVFFRRRIDGKRVIGHGVRVVFEPDGLVSSAKVMWRNFKKVSRHPVSIDAEEARSRFERDVDHGNGARFEVRSAELAYLDASLRDEVDFVEPEYVFIHTGRTPVRGKPDEFVVPKYQVHRIPAVASGRTHRPTKRDLLQQQREAIRPLDEVGVPGPNDEEG